MSNLELKLLENCDKDSIKYKKLLESLKDLEYIQNDLHNVIIDQNNKIKNIRVSNEKIYDNLYDANIDLEYCDKSFFSYKPIIIGSCVGALFISPITALVGLKYLGLTSGLGGVLGGISGYKLQQI